MTKLILGALIGVFSLELTTVLWLNHGKFAYTLDDAYIHLRVAENLARGHYGLNMGESSSPCSSIVWPFLVTPFAGTRLHEYLPLLINLLCALGTASLFIHTGKRFWAGSRVTAFVLAGLLCGNVVGLIFTGMEHSLQVLLSVALAVGLIRATEEQRVPLWFPPVVVLAPLVRYECVAVSSAALIYLFVCKHRVTALASGTIMIILMGIFSFWLRSMNLPLLPMSVLVKTGGADGHLGFELLNNFLQRRPLFALVHVFAGYLLAVLCFHRKGQDRWLSVSAIIPVLAHLAFGKYGSFYRYEVYLSAFLLPIVFYLLRDALVRSNRFWLAIGCVVLASLGFVRAAIDTPIAANNIYDQHYQMHRLTVDYYRGPVAANDVGWISYGNPNYVLDLYGLASWEAYTCRLSRQPRCVMELTASKGIDLALIYDEWFQGQVPSQWVRVGQWRLHRRRIAPEFGTVSVYATSERAVAIVRKRFTMLTEGGG
ncbi:MAG: hypothetical protein LLG20_05910 [Acidobacteriales bacterium]|nr:hypothetical protein [Terriglobales bacterium]